MVAKPARTVLLGLLVAAAVAGGLLVVSGMRAFPRGSTASTADEGPIDEAPAPRSPRAAPAHRLLPSVPIVGDSSDRPAGAMGEAPAPNSAAVLDMMRRAVAMPPKGARSSESRANEISAPLSGVVRALRTTDPKELGALREQLADEVCAGRFHSDTGLIVLAKMMTFEANLGSARALGCAFEGRRNEDVVLWSLLDAWNVAGRPNLPAVSEIQQTASDERTRTRLATRGPNQVRNAWPRLLPADPTARPAGETNDVQRVHAVNEGTAAGTTGE